MTLKHMTPSPARSPEPVEGRLSDKDKGLFYTYMLRCSDGTYYVGHTDDLERRLSEHMSGVYPGYTYKRRPVTLVWNEYFSTRDDAKIVEKQLKGWSRAKKEALIQDDWTRISELARNRVQD
jgi:predicted GIY-YIG superfamily endonuclease